MTDESLMLDIDIIEKKHETELDEIKEKLAEKENALTEKQNDLEKAESEIARLKKLLDQTICTTGKIK